ncbi:MAG: GNVR domain-containing protein [Pirellulaceae bacterium]
MTIFDIVYSIFHFKWRVMLVTLVMLAAAIAIIMLLPRKYESEAKMFVRLGRSSASVDPATVGSMISIQESRETEMNSIIDMIKSRGLADDVVDEIGIDTILEKFAWSEVKLEQLSDQISSMISSKIDDDRVEEIEGIGVSEQKELAVAELMDNLKVSSPKKSTTISVVYRARSPELAYRVVQSVIAKYQQMHILSTKSSGSVSFFEEEFQKQKSQLESSELELQKLKDQAAMLSLDGKQQSLQEEQNTVMQLQLQTKAELKAAQSRVASLQASLDLLPERIDSETTKGIEAGASDAMRERLYELEIKEKELANRFFDDHPELKKVRQQLTEAREIFNKQAPEREHTVTTVNPIWQQKRSELMSAEADVAGLETKLSELERLEQELVARIETLNQLKLKSDSLSRDIEIARENYSNYARKLEEARINAELDREELSNVSVVSPPVMRMKPVSPKRTLLALVGGVFAVLTGIFTALTSDALLRNRNSRLAANAATVNPVETVQQPTRETRVASTVADDDEAVSNQPIRQPLPR